jgi:hypothetical protein
MHVDCIASTVCLLLPTFMQASQQASKQVNKQASKQASNFTLQCCFALAARFSGKYEANQNQS